MCIGVGVRFARQRRIRLGRIKEEECFPKSGIPSTKPRQLAQQPNRRRGIARMWLVGWVGPRLVRSGERGTLAHLETDSGREGERDKDRERERERVPLCYLHKRSNRSSSVFALAH